MIGGEVTSGLQLTNDIGGSRTKGGVSKHEMEGVTDEWMVASFTNKRPPVRPMAWQGHLAIAGDEMTEYDRTYYWQAPDTYSGKRLYAYGNSLSFQVGYTVLRGDVSGFATQDADVILQGGPHDLSIGYRWTRHEQKVNGDARLSLSVPLREQQWVRLDSSGRPTDEPVSREQFALILFDLKRLLVRAKFHTDQIEGRLYAADLAQAKLHERGPIAVGTEKCSCPPGYTGLSCEQCSPGYKQVLDTYGVRCEPCACNGHSLVCDPRCECLHNTTGSDCGHCADGFYGNPLRGTPDDCKPCKCPAGARCTSTLNGEDFRCSPCPVGHTGDHCDQCEYGYFGQPTAGIPCQRCQCAPSIDVFVPGACDPITGQCRCSNNTGGVKCDECLPDHWGNPLTSTGCRACACNPRGALSTQCNRITGACPCRRNFAGPRCDRCAAGFGNVALDCPQCACNATGSVSVDCDPLTGVCECKPGVAGDRCDKCAPEHYGFGDQGCRPCACHVAGSLSASCDPLTGQCVCLDGFEGRDCSECVARHVRDGDRCLACDDGVCLTVLLDDLEHIQRLLQNAGLDTLKNLPVKKLAHLTGIARVVAGDVEHYRYLVRDSRQRLENVSYAFDTEAFVDILNLKAIELAHRVPPLLRDAQRAGESAQQMLMFVNQLIDELFKLVEMLRHYRPYNVLQDLQRLLREAEQVQKQLSGRAFKASLEEAQRELRKAHALLERVGSVLASPAQHGPTSKRLDLLERLSYETLQTVQEQVQKPLLGAIEHVSSGRQLHVQVTHATSNSTRLADAADTQLSVARHLLDATKQLLVDLQLLLERLPARLQQLVERIALLQTLHDSLKRLSGQKDPAVAACARHASDLLARVAYLKNMFLPSEELSRYAMRAANVYQSIVDALAAAADAARRAFAAAERAQTESSGDSGDRQPLATRASDALKNAHRLLESAKQLRDTHLSELERQLHHRLFALDKLSEQLAGSESTLHVVTRELTKLSSTYVEGVRPQEGRLRELLQQLEDLHKRLDEMEFKIRNELLARLERLKDSSPSGLESLGRLIEKARLDIRNADKLAYSAEQRWTRLHKHKQQLGVSLRELWQKIQQARHRAGSVRVSLAPNANGICIRSYEPPNDGPLFTSVTINYATRDASKNSLLFWLGVGSLSVGSNSATAVTSPAVDTKTAALAVSSNEYLAIELVDRHIRLLWNLGGGPQTLQHPLEIEPNDPGLLNDMQWYRISVLRVGNTASLSVQRTPQSDRVDSSTVRGSSPPGHTRLSLDGGDVQLLVGGLPAGFEPPRELRTRSFAGCMYELAVNGRRVGLWNFRSNVGCAGCREGASAPHSASAAHFTRPGYALLPQPSRYDPRKYLLALQMRTLQEHALLLFAGNAASGDYFALSISQGRLRLQLSAGGARLELRSRLRYNNGQWVRVAAERDRHEAILSVDDEIIEGTLTTAGGGSASPLLELAGALLHVGGVPPNFSHADWPDLDTGAYLGCVHELQVDSTPLWVLGGEHHGVEPGCQPQVAWQAAASGNGFVELPSRTMAEDADLSLSFRSKQTDALLLLSTFEGQPKISSRDSVMHFLKSFLTKLN
jgi:laminin alpha 3/5